jgi:putative phosphoesterase
MRLPLGVIADTHGLLDPQVLSAFRTARVGHILHAGDVVGRSGQSASTLLSALEEIAPITAVRGNADDKHDPRHGLPRVATVCASGLRCVMHHGDLITGGDDAVLAALEPEGGWRPSGDVAVSGHSHTPRLTWHRGVLLLNPGSAGPQRFRLPRQAALLDCDSAGRPVVRAIALGGGEASVSDWAAAVAPPPKTASAKRKRAAPVLMSSAGADAGSRALGTVGHCFVKVKSGAPLAARQSLELIAQLGPRGSIHNDALSPRQLLLQSSAVARHMGAVAGAFRENLCIDVAGDAAWPPPSGSVLRFESGAALRVTFACEPCGTGAAHAGIDLDALKPPLRGILATVVEGGAVGVGDRVAWDKGVAFEALPDKFAGRVRRFVAKVPRGEIVSYDQLIWFAGGLPSHARAMPSILTAAASAGLPIHRVVAGGGRLVGAPKMADQQAKLEAEGVAVEGGVVKATKRWDPTHAELFLAAPAAE